MYLDKGKQQGDQRVVLASEGERHLPGEGRNEKIRCHVTIE